MSASLLGQEPPVAAKAPVNAKGFDVDAPLTAAACQAFRAAGFAFAVRYLSRAAPGSSADLDAAETATIAASGLALMAVQHVAASPWVPSAALGAAYGAAAAANATSANLPAGVTLWLDLEGVQAGTDPQAVIAYCNAWTAKVQQAGFVAGLYVGANAILTGDQLYNDLTLQFYWQSGSTVPALPVRGYCMVQTIDPAFSLAGYAYDSDVITGDNAGGTPVWAVAAPPIA